MDRAARTDTFHAGPRRSRLKFRAAFRLGLLSCLFAALILTGCGGGSGAEQTSGASFTPATSINDVTFDEASATGENGALIDTSHVAQGYVGVSATSQARLKLIVTSGEATYNYDIPEDATPAFAPLTFGSGAYQFRVMQNTSGNNYVELCSTTADVELESEFAPYLRPSIICNYSEDSACVAKARELVADATTQAEAVEDICEWIVGNVSYDDEKAAELADATGYISDPDETLSSGKGICLDYAALGAAMLRSQNIPTQIVTGYVSPDGIYHAWIMVYIDGTWTSAQFKVSANTWSRVDLTFAASGSGGTVGDGKEYTDRFVY